MAKALSKPVATGFRTKGDCDRMIDQMVVATGFRTKGDCDDDVG